jgi:DUSP domain
MATEIKENSIWYVISMKWLEAAQKWLYFDYAIGQPLTDVTDEERPNPGPVDNSDIIE